MTGIELKKVLRFGNTMMENLTETQSEMKGKKGSVSSRSLEEKIHQTERVTIHLKTEG